MKYIKSLIDGFCECANCNSIIQGHQWFNTNHSEFVCKKCKETNK
jgi:hypothetical protein